MSTAAPWTLWWPRFPRSSHCRSATGRRPCAAGPCRRCSGWPTAARSGSPPGTRRGGTRPTRCSRPRRHWPSPSSARRARAGGCAPSWRVRSSAACSPSGRCAAPSTRRRAAPTAPPRSHSRGHPDPIHLAAGGAKAMAIHNYRTTSEHKRPVAAGTVIVFKLEPEPPGDHRIQWHINGPFTNMTRDMPCGPTFDWYTEVERAVSYEFFACVYPPSSTNPDDTGGQPGMPQASAAAADIDWSGNGAPAAAAPAIATKMTLAHDTGDGIKAESWTVQLTPAPSVNQEGVLPVSLQRTALVETVDQALWVIIRDRTNAVGFRPYKTFIDNVMGGDLPFRGGDAYALLKFATDAFLMQEVGVLDPLGVIRAGLVKDNNRGTALMDPESAFQSLEAQLDDPTQSEALRTQEERRLGRPINLAELKRMRDSYYVALKEETPPTAVLPYLRIIRERLADIPLKPPGAVPRSAYGILRSHLTAPLAVELIWSYWHEEGMLAQTLNAILARF